MIVTVSLFASWVKVAETYVIMGLAPMKITSRSSEGFESTGAVAGVVSEAGWVEVYSGVGSGAVSSGSGVVVSEAGWVEVYSGVGSGAVSSGSGVVVSEAGWVEVYSGVGSGGSGVEVCSAGSEVDS